MTRQGRVLIRVVLLVLASGVTGCGDGFLPTSPLPRVTETPSPPPPPPPQEIRLVVFTDPVTGLQTSDVHDVHGQVLRFNTASTLIWSADGREFPQFPTAYGYDRSSIVMEWGTEKKERRLYLTFSTDYWHYPPPASRVDMEVEDGKLVIRHPDPPVTVPGS